MISLDGRLDRLAERLDELAADLQLVRTLLARDPHSTLNKIRYITEGVLFRLCKAHGVTWGRAEPTLENMMGPLLAAGHVPKHIGIHLRTIQANASPGSHFQERPLDHGHVQIALLALVDVLEWFVTRDSPSAAPSARARTRWTPRIVHPLPPARHFAGRTALLARLDAWWTAPTERERVVSLVAIGGTGKTALVQRMLEVPAPAGVFAWSFYEDARTEALLAEALGYFGVGDVEVGARLERLRAFLSTAPESHVIVLDGLEAVQSAGGTGRLRGRIEDASIRLLLRSLAGGLGRTRALVTTRSRLVDLDDWLDRGHTAITVDDLDIEATRAVLRGWGVHGSDAELDALHARVGGHALSVAVIGSYIASFCEGDAGRFDELPLEAAAEDDLLAARLATLLDRYAAALPADERDLLVRLCAFPRGADATTLAFVTSDPSIAASLAGGERGWQSRRRRRGAARRARSRPC